MLRTELELDQILVAAEQRQSMAQIGDETRRLLSVLNGRPVRRVIEIGSEEGGTLSLWLKMFPRVHIVNVDLNSYPHAANRRAELEARWQSWCNPKQRITTIWGDSHDRKVFDQVADQFRLPDSSGWEAVDLLFIDGDHSALGVQQDYRMYNVFVGSPGLIVFNDIHPYKGRESGPYEETVYKFWEPLKGPVVDQAVDRSFHPGKRPNWVEICHDCKNQQSFGYGLIYV